MKMNKSRMTIGNIEHLINKDCVQYLGKAKFEISCYAIEPFMDFAVKRYKLKYVIPIDKKTKDKDEFKTRTEQGKIRDNNFLEHIEFYLEKKEIYLSNVKYKEGFILAPEKYIIIGKAYKKTECN